MKTRHLTIKCASLLSLAFAFAGLRAEATTITKADNTNALGLATSWVGGSAPTGTDIANWSGTFSADLTTNSLRAVLPGAAVAWQGISVGSLAGPALTTNTIYVGVTNISAATQSGSTVTISTKANHGFSPGQSVTIAGVTPAGYNGTFTVLGVPSATTFTYVTAAGLTAGTAFGTVESAFYIGGIGTTIASSALTIGSAGIDLSAASHSVALNAATFSFSGAQSWNLAAGRNLRFSGNNGVGGASAKVVTSGSDGLIDISGGGIVDANQGGASGFSDVGGFTGFTGSWRVNTGATLRGLRNGATAWGANTAPDAITLNGGTLAVGGISGAVGNWTWNTPITLASGKTSFLDEHNVAGSGRYLKLNGAFAGAGNLTFKDTGPAGAFTSADLGYILTGANTMSGTVTIGGPVENGIAGRLTFVRVGGLGGTSTATGIGPDGSLGTATIVNNGVLTFSLNGPITVNTISGTGSLRVGYTATAGAENQTVTLTGVNPYSGNTTVNMGSLVLPAGASIPNTANIFLTPLTAASLITVTLDVSAAGGLSLNSGQRLVGGPNNSGLNNSAQVTGDVTAGTGSALVPGGTNVVNSLSIAGNLNLTGGATLVYDLNNSAGDLLTVQDLNPAGVTTIFINPPANGLFAGTYPLIAASGAMSGSSANFKLEGLVSTGRGQTFSLVYDTSTPGAYALKLVVVGSPGTLTWRGDGTTNAWDAASTNWLNAGLPDTFFSGDFVTFDETGSSTPAINLTGVLQAGSVTVSATKDYTFTGTGKLTGSGSLTNVGPGKLSILTSNDFTGKTVIVGSTLAITNEAALGANPTTFTADQLTLDGGVLAIGAPATLRHLNRGITLGTSGGSLDIGSANVTVSNVVTGAGALIKTGSGTLTMSGSNTYTGGTWVNGGKVAYGHGSGLGRGASTLGTSGYFVKPFTLQSGSVDLGGKTSYDPNFAGGTAAIGVPVMLYDGPVVFASGAGATLSFQDTGGTATNGWGNGTASANTLTYDATANPGTATISARFAGSGSSGVTSRTFEVGDSTATAVEVDITGALGVISVNSTNQDGRNTTLVKSGEGTLRVSAPNNFPAWQVNAGTLLVNHAQALGTDRTISTGVSGGTGSPNTLTVQGGVADLNGFSFAIGGLNDNGSSAGIIRNNGGVASLLTVGLSGTNSVSASYGSAIENGTGGLSLVKVGSGTQALGGVNTYTGGTVVSNGTLLVNGSLAGTVAVRSGGAVGGTGTIGGLVTVDAGGTLGVGTNFGTLTLNTTPVLNGMVRAKVDRNEGAPMADQVAVPGQPISYHGTLVVANTGALLQPGDTFTLFSASSYSGSFTIAAQTPGQIVTWNVSNLAVNGSLSVATVAPVPLTAAASGDALNVSWPAEATGAQLQMQANELSVGISTNWVAVAGSTFANQVSVPIVATNPCVFLRLVYPPQ